VSFLAHIPHTAIIQAAGYALLWLFVSHDPDGLWIAGLAAFVAMFMREVAQAEYRYIEQHGGLRANMPDLEGLKFWKWNRHSVEEQVGSGVFAALAWSVWSYVL
jgi:hypothetical protein